MASRAAGVYPEVPERLAAPGVDTHTHLDICTGNRGPIKPGEPAPEVDPEDGAEFPPLSFFYDTAQAAGITRIVQIGCEMGAARWTAEVVAAEAAAGRDWMLGGAAIHPNEAPRLAAAGLLDESLTEIEQLLRADRMRVVGETGLDYFRTSGEGVISDPQAGALCVGRTDPRALAAAAAVGSDGAGSDGPGLDGAGADGEGSAGAGSDGADSARAEPVESLGGDLRAQQESFRAHIEIAKRLGLALQIHDREAHADVLRILREEGAPEVTIFHCFSGDAQMARECAAQGYFMSFAGNVTFKNAHDLRAAAAEVPDELLLSETDAPFLTPHPYRGKPGGPYLAALTIRKLAEVRGTTEADVANLVTANAERALGPWTL